MPGSREAIAEILCEEGRAGKDGEQLRAELRAVGSLVHRVEKGKGAVLSRTHLVVLVCMLFYEDLRGAPGGPVGLKGLSTVGKKYGRPKPFPGLQIRKQCAKCILIPWVCTEWKTVVCIDFSLGWRDVYGARHGWRTERLGQENNVGKGQQEHRFQIANIILSALESSVILCRGLHRLEHSGSVLCNSCPSDFWLFFNMPIFQKLK